MEETRGYYGKNVDEQTANWLQADGPFDIYDVTDSNSPRKVTGYLGALNQHYARYWIANYGMSGHKYRVEGKHFHATVNL